MGSGRQPSSKDHVGLAAALVAFVTCVHFTDYPKSKDWAARRIDLLQQKNYLRMFRWAGKYRWPPEGLRRIHWGHRGPHWEPSNCKAILGLRRQYKAG
jgi:hypothetical protein